MANSTVCFWCYQYDRYRSVSGYAGVLHGQSLVAFLLLFGVTPPLIPFDGPMGRS